MSATTVLIVDDDVPAGKSTGRLFRATGCEVFLAAGAHEALDVVRSREPIDLVVSDFEMPGMRGTDLVSVIRQISPDTLQVLMTGALIDPGAVPEGVPLVRKPFSLEELLAAARAAVEHSERLRLDFVRNRKQFEELKARRQRLLSAFANPQKK